MYLILIPKIIDLLLKKITVLLIQVEQDIIKHLYVIQWLQTKKPMHRNKMAEEDSIHSIGKILCCTDNPLKQRFRALFTLRNLGGEAAIDCMAECFSDTSALLKHELAYCLGQMGDKYAIPVLIRLLEDSTEYSIVRHEAGKRT